VLEEIVHLCEPQQGPLFGEDSDEDDENISIEYILNYVESSK